jgi:alcohol dehydrogenase class IV
VLETNLRAVEERAPLAAGRFAEVAQLLTGVASAQAMEGIAWLKELTAALKIPPLAAYGIKKADFPEIIAQAQRASSMQGNPIKLNEAELMTILEQAL